MATSVRDLLQEIAAEHAIEHQVADAFQLDRLNRYPGTLPFETVAEPTSQPAESTLQLRPELIAEITRELAERPHAVEPTPDPLERLAEQLSAFDFPTPETSPPTEPSTPAEPLPEPALITDTPPSASKADAATEAVSVEPEAETAAPPRSWWRVVAAIAAVALVGGVYLLQQWWHQWTPSAQRSARSTVQQPPPTEKQPQASNTATPLPRTAPIEQPAPEPEAAPTPHPKRQRQAPPIAAAQRPQQPITQEQEEAPLPRRTRPPAVQPSETVVVPPALEPPRSEGSYAIQVCATPSYAEALRWKQHLERAGAQNVTILERRQREELYYRVRIGGFRSRLDALQAARQLGLSTSAIWIVRID